MPRVARVARRLSDFGNRYGQQLAKIRSHDIKKIDQLFVLIGLAVASFLTWYAYYSNSHREAVRISEVVYLLLFPSSIGLMVTENATSMGQTIIVSIVVAVNGALYGSTSVLVRKIFSER
jgi:hypothetical protein